MSSAGTCIYMHNASLSSSRTCSLKPTATLWPLHASAHLSEDTDTHMNTVSLCPLHFHALTSLMALRCLNSQAYCPVCPLHAPAITCPLHTYALWMDLQSHAHCIPDIYRHLNLHHQCKLGLCKAPVPTWPLTLLSSAWTNTHMPIDPICFL